MRVYGIFHGGHSYSTHWTVEDIEQFNSLHHAKETFWSRTDWDPYYPCTDESAEMWIFLADPVEGDILHSDLYPDRIINLGPRGGVVVRLV